MTDATVTDTALDDPAPPRRPKRALLLGLILALVLAGGGFYAVYSGLLLGDGKAVAPHSETIEVTPLPDVAFVPIEPMVINLGQSASNRHLRFRAELEVDPAYRQQVTDLMPRVVDVLNGYLRAVRIDDLEEPTALIKLRAQMLRRVQIVTGEGRVRDLLVMEFVLN